MRIKSFTSRQRSDGRVPPYAMLERTGKRTLGPDSHGGGQCVDDGSTWNGEHPNVADHHLGIDETGVLRIKNGVPSDKAGSVAVGPGAND